MQITLTHCIQKWWFFIAETFWDDAGEEHSPLLPDLARSVHGLFWELFEQVVSGRPVFIAFQPSPDLEALSRRFESAVVMREPGELISALERLRSQNGSGTQAPVPEIATKKYWAGELAGFLNEILERGTAVVPNARGSSIRAAGS